MEFPGELSRGILLRRYKRFLADVKLDNGEEITVHCPNTGAMTGCADPGSPVWLSHSDSSTRKYPYTWELVDTDRGMACIHSARANPVLFEAVERGRVPELAGYARARREVKYGEGSRADLVLEGDGPRCVVEVKSVTLCLEDSCGAFPDAVSVRARKHLLELESVAAAGERAVIFFCVFHCGIERVRAARDIDPAYAEALQQALAGGVEMLAWRAAITAAGVELDRPLRVSLD